jgi:hypothetical protein
MALRLWVLLLLSLLLVILLLQLLFALPGPPSTAAETAGKTPKGRRAWMHVVFCRDMDVASENPAGGVDP